MGKINQLYTFRMSEPAKYLADVHEQVEIPLHALNDALDYLTTSVDFLFYETANVIQNQPGMPARYREIVDFFRHDLERRPERTMMRAGIAEALRRMDEDDIDLNPGVINLIFKLGLAARVYMVLYRTAAKYYGTPLKERVNFGPEPFPSHAYIGEKFLPEYVNDEICWKGEDASECLLQQGAVHLLTAVASLWFDSDELAEKLPKAFIDDVRAILGYDRRTDILTPLATIYEKNKHAVEKFLNKYKELVDKLEQVEAPVEPFSIATSYFKHAYYLMKFLVMHIEDKGRARSIVKKTFTPLNFKDTYHDIVNMSLYNIAIEDKHYLKGYLTFISAFMSGKHADSYGESPFPTFAGSIAALGYTAESAAHFDERAIQKIHYFTIKQLNRLVNEGLVENLNKQEVKQ